jgi:hypothetical protein
MKRWGSFVVVVAVVASGLVAAVTAPAVVAASSAAGMTARPAIRGSASPGVPTISENWSGYAATGSNFTYVHSRFVQPAVTCTGAKNQWTSNWVGLDGFADGTVEQDGTFAHCGGKDSTTPMYQAWYEMYPAGSVNVFPVHPGDVIDTTVDYRGSKFHLTVADLTTGRAGGTVAGCASCARSSAEWIIERPALCNNAFTKCFLTALADFGTTTMNRAWARSGNGTVQGINSFTNYPIYMVTPAKGGGFISLDAVGPVTHDSFTATWDRAGSIVPIHL